MEENSSAAVAAPFDGKRAKPSTSQKFDEWGRPDPYRQPATREEKRRELACDIYRLKSLPPAMLNTEIVARWRRQEIARLQAQLYEMGDWEPRVPAVVAQRRAARF